MEILKEFKWRGVSKWRSATEAEHGLDLEANLCDEAPWAFRLLGTCVTITADTPTNLKKWGFTHKIDLHIGRSFIFSEYAGGLAGPPMHIGPYEFGKRQWLDLHIYRQDHSFVSLAGGVEIENGSIDVSVALIGVRLPLSVTSTYVPA